MSNNRIFAVKLNVKTVLVIDPNNGEQFWLPIILLVYINNHSIHTDDFRFNAFVKKAREILAEIPEWNVYVRRDDYLEEPVLMEVCDAA